jgi:hypothetical protein
MLNAVLQSLGGAVSQTLGGRDSGAFFLMNNVGKFSFLRILYIWIKDS